MKKWKIITKVLLLAFLLTSCLVSPDAPKLKREPKQYIYADDPDLWCRKKKDKSIECVENLRRYGLYHINDIKMIQKYIVDLNNECEKWRQ